MARMTLDQLLRANIVSGDIWQPLTQKLGVPGWEYAAEAVNEGGNATGTGIADANKLGRLQGYTFDWQNTGPENTGTLIAYDPSGNPVGSFDQQDQSAGSAFAEWAALAAAGFGGAALAGFGGPLGGLLGGAGGASQVGSSVAGVGGEAAANLAAYGGTLTPAQVAATAGFDLGAAGGFGAGGLGATGAITGGAGLVAPTVGAGAGVGAGLGSTGAAGAAGTAGSAAGSAGFWTGALKTVAPVLGSVAGGLIQSNAAGKAANAQTAAARAGMEAIQKALAPYQQAGAQAIGGQQDLLGLNGPAKQQAAIDAIRMSPAFTSQQQLGENRILANASATGGLRGGNVQGALAQFSPALLSSLIDQQYQRLGGLTEGGIRAAGGVATGAANGQAQIGSAQAGGVLGNATGLTQVIGGLSGLGEYLGGGKSETPTVQIPQITTNTPFGQFQLGGGLLMGPQNYTLGNVIDPGLAFSQGLQSGEQRLMLQQQQAMQLQQQQAALQAQQRREAALQRVIQNPRAGAQGYADLMLLMPKESEAIKRSWETLNSEQSKSRLSDLTQWTAAIEAGKPEFAVSAMLAQADALDGEAGQATPEGQALRAQAEIVKADPTTAARVLLKPLLFAHPDGGKVLDNIAKQGAEQRAAELQPLKVRQETADATTKEVAAQFAKPKALADLEKTGWDIKAIQGDIEYKKQATRIAAMNAALNREGNDLKRQELQLKVDEARGKLDTAAREKVAEFDSRISGVTDARTLIREIKELRDTAWVNPTGITATAGYMPGSNARTQFGKIDQLKNVLSLEYLDKLKGPTSDRDIAFLKAIAANLDSLQSDASFAGELEKVDSALARVDAATRKKYGAPPAPKPSKPAPAGNSGGVTVSGW